MASFNLVDERWIPVRRLDDTPDVVGIREVLLNAADFREIEDPSPLATVALHRLLLAVLHRALEGPDVPEEDVPPWMEHGFPPDKINDYLKRWHDRFDLFHPTTPFYQVAGLQSKEVVEWTYLLPEVGSWNTSALFNDLKWISHDLPPASPDIAARALLTHQMYCLGGKNTGISTSELASPVATQLLVIAMGDDLLETLCLNLVEYANPTRDLPIWEREDTRVGTERVRGQVHAYTWQTRSILLIPEQENSATVVRDYRAGAGVRRVEDDFYADPMGIYVPSSSSYTAMKLDTEKAFWRDFRALIPRLAATREGIEPTVIERALSVHRARNATKPPRALVVGMVNNKAKILMWRAERFDLPPAILSDRDVYETVDKALTYADDVGNRLAFGHARLAQNLLTQGDREPLRKDVNSLAATFPGSSFYWTTLEAEFPGFLAQLTLDYSEEDVLTYWDETLYSTLRKAWNATVRHVGGSAAALRAIAKAEEVLNKTFAELHKRTTANETASEAR